MNVLYKTTEEKFSEEDEQRLKNILSRSFFEFKIIAVFSILISLLLPFLPPKYTGNKAMLDIMSYYSAVTGILLIFFITGAWAYYYMIMRLKRDIREKRKIVLRSTVYSKSLQGHKGHKSYLVKAAGLPARLSAVAVSAADFEYFEKGMTIKIEYSKTTKRQLGVYRV